MKVKEKSVMMDQIYLGKMTVDGKFIKLTMCLKLEDSLINLEDLKKYPKSDYAVERGIIHYYFTYLTEIINLYQLFHILGYQQMNSSQLIELNQQFCSDFIYNIIEEKKDNLSEEDNHYLKKIYEVLKIVERQKGEKKKCKQIKQTSMLGV